MCIYIIKICVYLKTKRNSINSFWMEKSSKEEKEKEKEEQFQQATTRPRSASTSFLMNVFSFPAREGAEPVGEGRGEGRGEGGVAGDGPATRPRSSSNTFFKYVLGGGGSDSAAGGEREGEAGGGAITASNLEEAGLNMPRNRSSASFFDNIKITTTNLSNSFKSSTNLCDDMKITTTNLSDDINSSSNLSDDIKIKTEKAEECSHSKATRLLKDALRAQLVAQFNIFDVCSIY